MPWKILVDHINVDAGDSTLIRVINTTDNTIAKAILIDAGYEWVVGKRVHPFLIKALKQKNDYKSLDAIVVTHYDADHMGGIVKLLQQIDPKNSNNSLPYLQKPFIVYDPGCYNNNSTNNATKLFKTYKKFIEALKTNKQILHATPWDNTDGANNILGYDILWRGFDQDIPSSYPPLPSTLAELRKRNFDIIESDPKPALYCVAINKHTLSIAPAVTLSNSLYPSNDHVLIVGSGDVTDKNKRSLAFVLVSPQDNICHYLCGDASSDIEAKIVLWIKQQMTEKNQRSVPVIKFSHHGSKFSTPINDEPGITLNSAKVAGLLEVCQPQYGIISAGSKHYHPSLELIEYGLFHAPNCKFVATNYPYYLAREDIFGGLNRKLQTYLEDGQHREAYEKAGLADITKLTRVEASQHWSRMGSPRSNPVSMLDLAANKRSKIDEYPTVPQGVRGKAPWISTRAISFEPPNYSPLAVADENDYGINTISGSKKRKRRLLNLLLADTTAITLGISTDSSATYQLKAGSTLEKFLRAIPSILLSVPRFTLIHSTLTQADQITLKGNLIDIEQDELGHWLNEAGFASLQLTVTGTLEGKILDIAANNIEFTGTMLLVDTDNKPVAVAGKIDATTNTLVLSYQATKVDILATSINLNVLDNSAKLYDKLKTALHLTPALSLAENSLIIINPANDLNVSNTILFELADKFNLLGDVFKLKNNVYFGFESDQAWFHGDQISFNYRILLGATLKLSDTVSVNVQASFIKEGLATLIFRTEPQQSPVGVISALMDLLNIDKTPFHYLLNDLNFSVELNNSIQITLNIDLVNQKITRIMLAFGLHLYQFDLIANLILPDYSLWGELKFDAAVALPRSVNNLNIENDEKDNDDDSVDSKDISSSRLSTKTANELFSAHGIPDPGFGGTCLADVEFTAVPKIKSYSFNAILSKSWKFTDELELEKISFGLIKKAQEITVDMTAFFRMGEMMVMLEGGYASQDGWQFTAEIDELNFKDIFSLLPGNNDIVNGLKKLMNPKFDTIVLKLGIPKNDPGQTTRYFSITLKTNGMELILIHRTLNQKGAGDKQYQIFAIAKFILPTTLSNFPLVGQLNSPIDQIQLIASTSTLTESDVNFFGNHCDGITIAAKTMNRGIMLQIPSLKNPNGSSLTLQLPTVTSSSQPSKPIPPQWSEKGKSLGPITLRRLGLTYVDNKICLMLDAVLALGKIMLELKGLALRFSLNDLIPEFHLDGLGIAYQAPPLMIVGEWDKVKPTSQTEKLRFNGQAVISAANFNLQALGSFSYSVDEQTQQKKREFFIFADMVSKEGIGGPPYFYVKGLMGGMGYHKRLRLPKQNEVYQFPLLQGMDDATAIGGTTDNPLQVLAAMEQTPTQWLTNDDAENWLAFGVDFTSFGLVNSKALFVAEFGHELAFDLLGRSIMKLPPEGFSVTYVEMDLEAVVKPEEGIFVSARLSPNSYLLHPDCHLTGGFAFYSWFAGKNKDDFVITLGGYHPAFDLSKNRHYPQEPRLGFNWSWGNHVTISGKSYCALTPSCLMAGGSFDILFHAGNLRAWLDAYANLLMQWKPVYFEASGGVDIGVSYKLDLLFFSVTLQLEIGASLFLQGPTLRGDVHIDLDIISFTISFGDSKPAYQALKWPEFKLLLPTKQISDKQANDMSSTTVEVCKIRVTQGLMKTEKIEQKLYYYVRPDEFSFVIESVIPLTKINLEVANNVIPVKDEKDKEYPDDSVNIYPMQLKDVHCQQHVVLKPQRDAAPPTRELTTQVIKRNVPGALWGIPTGRKPSAPSGGTLPDRWIGLSLTAPDETISGLNNKTSGPINLKVNYPYIMDEKEDVRALPYYQPSASQEKIITASRKDVTKKLSQFNIKTLSPTVTYLQDAGLFRKGVSLSSLQRFAKQADKLYIVSPLLASKKL